MMPAMENATETLPPLRVRVRPTPRTQNEPKTQPPYAVILHNDSVNGFDWVVGVMRSVIRCGPTRAFWLVLKAHVGGRGRVWSGSLEVAEFKAEQIRAAGPDPRKIEAGAKPLRISIEPLPG